jgi:YD repeat-containing protein
VPKQIDYADTSRVSVIVSDFGAVTQVTDENLTVTGYQYDPMDRLTLIDYTDADTVPWTSTNRTFAPITQAEYGVPAGSWKQMLWTGNGQTTTWFNARWQPVLVLTEDIANAATRSYVVTRYDSEGRLSFKSYPVAALSSIADPLAGVDTEYDGLGRVTKVKQASELGSLETTTDYLTGFQARVTNPRGFVTTTDYQAFDVPSTDSPTRIVAAVGYAEQQTTEISRDEFGNPKTIKRTGAGAQP